MGSISNEPSQLMSLVPSKHTSASVFPLTSELWSWQKSRSLYAPVNFHCPKPPLLVFNLGTSFLGQVAFSSFQLDLFFLWFKPPFRIFALNLYPFSFFFFFFLFFYFTCHSCPFGFSILASHFSWLPQA